MIGTTLGHYRTVEEIGAGGMGVVFRDIKPSFIFLCSDGRVKILEEIEVE